MLSQSLMRVIGAVVCSAAVIVSGVSYANPESEAERDFMSQPAPDYEALYWHTHPEQAQKLGIKQRPSAINKMPAYRSRGNDQG